MPATLIPISSNSQIYRDAENKFSSAWSNPTIPQPPVVNVFYVNHEHHKVWYNYKPYIKRVGNEKYMWHGTTRACTIGDDNSKVTACHHSNCGVCNILRATLDPTRADKNSMLGLGAYVAPSSSKAASYLKNHHKNASPNLVLIRCAVAVGHTFTTQRPMKGRKKPPSGYDSISAKKGYTSNGRKTVSNDETCVFTKDAILPVQIVVLRDLNSTYVSPYNSFSMRLRNVTDGDWNKYPEAIRNTYRGEILWTDGNAVHAFVSAPNITAYKVVRRVPENSPNGRVVAEGLASSSPFYFRLE